MTQSTVDPMHCARMAAKILQADTSGALIQEAHAWTGLGQLLISLRDVTVDAAAHDVAYNVDVYFQDPTDTNLGIVHQSLHAWRQLIDAP